MLRIYSFGQFGKPDDTQINNSGANKLYFASSNDEAKSFALNDINNNIPFLLVQGGISPIVYYTDSLFENKYHVFYLEFGCSGPKNEFIIEYNKSIFRYLTKTYNKKWRKGIRKDVIGLKQYKKGD